MESSPKATSASGRVRRAPGRGGTRCFTAWRGNPARRVAVLIVQLANYAVHPSLPDKVVSFGGERHRCERPEEPTAQD